MLGGKVQQPLEPIPHPAGQLPTLADLGLQMAKQDTGYSRGAAAAKSSADRLCGDSIHVFNELSAGRGALGRFPGAGVMPLVCQFLGTQALGDK